jgi:hypothetical protein
LTAEEIINKISVNGMREMTDERIKQAMEEYAELRSISFVDSLRDYELEGHTILGFDERTTEELYLQFKKENP